MRMHDPISLNQGVEIQLTNITMISNALEVEEYYHWVVDLFKPHIGKRVLEIGAGIGTISKQLAHKTNSLVITDVDENCSQHIANKLNGHAGGCQIEYAQYKLGDPCPRDFINNPFDTIVISNVLEHVINDIDALVYLRDVLLPDGCLILFVPALQCIYGRLDRALGHVRRYSKKQLKTICEQAGYKILHIRFLNVLGIVGWWINGRVLKRDIVPESNFRYFKYLFPFVKGIESLISLPFGISLLAIAHKIR